MESCINDAKVPIVRSINRLMCIIRAPDKLSFDVFLKEKMKNRSAKKRKVSWESKGRRCEYATTNRMIKFIGLDYCIIGVVARTRKLSPKKRNTPYLT